MESYNKDFVKVFGGHHPSITKFVTDLENEAQRAWRAVVSGRNLTNNHGRKRKEVEWPEVPDEFLLDFVKEK